MGSSHDWPFVLNLGNSIIGVALLAMPFCFQKCGIVLSMLILLFCTWLTLISCQLLMKAGITSRRRSYEFLAYHTHGATGKLASEIGMIGFQLGTLIAQIVVIGDLGPSIVTKIFGIQESPGLRTFLMIFLCLTIGLPMALLKDIRAITRVSAVCVAFYFTFVLYVLWLALPNLWSGNWYNKVHFWKPEGLFQSLPILSFSFGCQTQLFLLYDALPEPSLKAMSKVVSSAVNLCAVAYLMVGFCGYIAFYSHDLPGDVISVFPKTFFTDLMKVCFVFSIVITFPVMVFPCRASIYTLLFAKKSKPRDDMMDLETHIPSKQLKIITTSIVVGSMIIAILIPNVEFILGMNGAIMGTLICYIFPALFFLKVMGSKPDGRNLAQLVLLFGVTILLVSTYATLRSQDTSKSHTAELSPRLAKQADSESVLMPKPLEAADIKLENVGNEQINKPRESADVNQNIIDGTRKEPPNPYPPNNKVKLSEDVNQVEKSDTKRDVIAEEVISTKSVADSEKMAAANKLKELELQEKEKKQEELLAQLEKQRIEQKILIEEQKQLLKEFKDHHDSDIKQQILAQSLQNPAQQQPQFNQQQPDGKQQIQFNQQQQAGVTLQVNQQQADAQPQVNQPQEVNVQVMQQKVSAQPQLNQQQQHQGDLQPQMNQQDGAQPQVSQQEPNHEPHPVENKQLLFEHDELLQKQVNDIINFDSINQQPFLRKALQDINQTAVTQKQDQVAGKGTNVIQPEQQSQHQQLPDINEHLPAQKQEELQNIQMQEFNQSLKLSDAQLNLQQSPENIGNDRDKIQQQAQNVEDLNRQKRDLNNSMNITNIIQSRVNSSSFDEKQHAHINQIKTTQDTTVTQVTQKTGEEQKANETKSLDGDSQNTKANEEMRKKLK